MSSLFAISLLLSLICGAKAATIRGANYGENENVVAPERIASRRLVADFVPLGCNANVASAICTPWSSQFGPDHEHSDRVVIPCGECVTMDHEGDTLTLDDGLDVQGRLVFPDNGYSLNLISPMITVQGNLDMSATKPVDGEPSIKFTMIGQNTNALRPIGENANACEGDCNIGKKSITVAGGKLNSKYS